MITQSKARRIAAWLLTGIITLIFVAIGQAKLLRSQSAVELGKRWGLGNYLFLIGVAEVGSALLFFFPRTNSLGGLLLSAYLGGAIATRIEHGEPYVFPSVLLILVWVAGYLRHPELLQSFREKKG
jgi:hypothetical protein